jgi:hypothetical protein
MITGFQRSAFQNSGFQIAIVSGTGGTAFQDNAFQNNAFQIGAVGASSHGGGWYDSQFWFGLRRKEVRKIVRADKVPEKAAEEIVEAAIAIGKEDMPIQVVTRDLKYQFGLLDLQWKKEYGEMVKSIAKEVAREYRKERDREDEEDIDFLIRFG